MTNERALECRDCGATHRPTVPCPPTDRWLISGKPTSTRKEAT